MWSIEPAAVLQSSATESAVGAETAASVAAASAALVSVLPMGADLDSAAFAAALNSCGTAYIGVAQEHVAQRELFSGTQALSSTTSVATEALRAMKF